MKDLIDRDEFNNWIKETKKDWVDITIAGQIFGGRPGEAPQEPTDFQIIDDTLLIFFNGTERLWVKSPKDISIINKQFNIQNAEVIRWGWHYYGRAKSPLNWAELLYIVGKDSIHKAEILPLDGLLDCKIELVDFDLNSPIVRIGSY